MGRAQQEWDPESIAGKLVAALRPYLGLHTAQSAVKTFCRPLEVEPAKLTGEHLRPLLSAMRPALNTLLGTRQAAALVQALLMEFGT